MMKHLRPIAIASCAWFVCVGLHALYYVNSVLSNAAIPDLYARAWDFQLLMFALFRLPYWVAVLAILLWAVRIRTRSPHAV